MTVSELMVEARVWARSKKELHLKLNAIHQEMDSMKREENTLHSELMATQPMGGLLNVMRPMPPITQEDLAQVPAKEARLKVVQDRLYEMQAEHDRVAAEYNYTDDMVDIMVAAMNGHRGVSESVTTGPRPNDES